MIGILGKESKEIYDNEYMSLYRRFSGQFPFWFRLGFDVRYTKHISYVVVMWLHSQKSDIIGLFDYLLRIDNRMGLDHSSRQRIICLHFIKLIK
jgi:hypothetical protein